jgi:hypothetical protein
VQFACGAVGPDPPQTPAVPAQRRPRNRILRRQPPLHDRPGDGSLYRRMAGRVIPQCHLVVLRNTGAAKLAHKGNRRRPNGWVQTEGVGSVRRIPARLEPAKATENLTSMPPMIGRNSLRGKRLELCKDRVLTKPAQSG